MARFELTGPDGGKYELEAPDENSALAAFGQLHGNAPPPVAAVDPKAADEAAISAVGTNRASTLANIRETPLIGSSLPKATAYLNALAAKMGVDPGAGMSKSGTISEMAAANEPVLTKGADAYHRQHPIETAIGGMAAGTGLLAPVGAISLGAKALGMTGLAKTAVPLGSATGAAIGAVDAVTRGEAPLTGGLVGGLTGGFGVLGGKALGAGYDAVRRAVRPAPIAPHVMDVNGRPVPVDKAIVSGTAEDSTAKQALIHQTDPKTAQIARDAMVATDEGLRGTVSDIKDAVGAGAGAEPHTPRSAAQALQEALQEGNINSRAGVKAAYDTAGAAPGEYNPSLIQNTPKVVRTQLGQGDKVILDDLTPRGTSAMGYLDKELGQMNLTTNAAGTPLKMGPDGRPMAEPITPNSVEQVRKNLNRYLKQAQKDGNAADVRAVTRIKDAFDSHITNATKTSGGFTGDAAEVLRLQADARAAHALHKQNYSAQAPGDLAGRTIENIIGKRGVAPLDTESIVPKIFGSPNNPGGGAPATLMRRLSDTLGPNSPAITALRQGAISHAADMLPGMAPVGHKALADRVTKLLEGNLGKELYTDAEREALRNIADAHRQVLPVSGTTNPPGSGHVVVRGMKAMARTALPIIGATTHGAPGFAVGLAAEKAATALANRTARKTAERFFLGERAKGSESKLPQRFGALGGYLAAGQSR